VGWALAPGCNERPPGEPTLDGGPDATPPPACLAAPDEGELRQWLAALTGEADVMIDGQPARITERASGGGRRRTRAYLQSEFQALGYSVRPGRI
jgi:hypothetical protein